MTLDVTIGEIYVDERDGKAYVRVVPCPPEPMCICDIEFTIYPNEAERSGGHGLWEFFRKYLNDIYIEMRDHPGSNDIDVAFINPFLDRINALSDKCDDPASNDRMKWLKFWCNRAVEQFGDDAGIMFS